MIDLTTRYLGLDLSSPLIPGASPLVERIDTVLRLEDAGAPAIVMRSLFEEEIEREVRAHQHVEASEGAFSEASSFLPRLEGYHLGPGRYLDLVHQIKSRVSVPVIASLNGSTLGGWTRYARFLEEAGADALELNLYHVATDANETSASIEERGLEILRAVKSEAKVPVAVKLSPFYSSFANYARRLDDAGADGLVLFNRFYQPDLDIDTLDILPHINLSQPEELPLRLRWLAILSGRVKASLAATGGVHSATDVVKALMAGAHAVQMVSALFINGINHLAWVREGMAGWMEAHGYESVRELQGTLSLRSCPDPAALERTNYVRVLESWRTS
jgi:dihydroorotate dehydrogenase (fumarate)